MSGTPMWQIKRKMVEYEKQRENLVQELIQEHEDRTKPADAPNVLVDTASSIMFGGSAASKAKPLVRHVLVKDLNKVAQLKNFEFPKTDLFQNKAPLGLYAIFDGQSSSTPGPAAAEYCARNFHTKVMENLKMLRQTTATAAYLKAALIKSFHELDADYLATKPQVEDGCGAAVALLLGNHIFIATLGRCGAWLAEIVEGRVQPMQLGSQAGASRFLGEPARKTGGGSDLCTPEVHSVELRGPDVHPFLMLAGSAMSSVLTLDELMEAMSEFKMQPRAACGEIVAMAMERAKSIEVPPQLLLAQVCFLPPKEVKVKPAAKKPKTSKTGVVGSLRLRHIMLKTQDATPRPGASGLSAGMAAAKAKVSRTRQEAEDVLRKILKDLRQNLKNASKAPRTVNDLIVFEGKKFNELCRVHSDCPTSQKGGAMCGDLGWMSAEDLGQLGGTFKEKVDPLKPGQWSDLCTSDQGVHVVQRVA